MGSNSNSSGFLPGVAFSTLCLFWLLWAAMHDIAHGDEGTLESIVLAITVPAFTLLYRKALRVLTSKEKMVWLIGTGLLIGLFSAGAVSSILHPKYPRDLMLASGFLAAGVPLLGLIGYRILREVIHRPVRPA